MDKNQVALLLVDIQSDFWTPLAGEPRFASFPTNVASLLETARRQGLPVIHTQAVFKTDGSDWMLFYRPSGRGKIPCIGGTSGVSFANFAKPRADEVVIRKQAFDGFQGTELEQLLRERHIQVILVAGLVTSVCVLFTATSAYLKRWVPVVVTDACADTAERHDATLGMYDGLCFLTATTAQARADLAAIVQRAGAFADVAKA
jgi:nicotinamidase-related amidase